MVQIENEIGMLEDARDHSPLAEAAFRRGVPEELMAYLVKNKKSLHPSLLKKWTEAGRRRSGSWTAARTAHCPAMRIAPPTRQRRCRKYQAKGNRWLEPPHAICP